MGIRSILPAKKNLWKSGVNILQIEKIFIKSKLQNNLGGKEYKEINIILSDCEN